MLLKKLNINFYKKIKRLINKNGFEIPNYKYWRKLWNANSNAVVGEGIFKGTNLDIIPSLKKSFQSIYLLVSSNGM